MSERASGGGLVFGFVLGVMVTFLGMSGLFIGLSQFAVPVRLQVAGVHVTSETEIERIIETRVVVHQSETPCNSGIIINN